MRKHCLPVIPRCFLILATFLCVRPASAADLAEAAQCVTQIVAHRGASLERPECTLAAIQRAIEVGATATEIDVRTSADGQLFLLHDKTLDRTTEGKGAAGDRTLAELRKLDAGSWFDIKFRGHQIPTLIEAAGISRGKIDLLLDLKEQGDEYDRKVVAVIREHGDPRKTLVGVRSVAQAVRFRKLLPEARQLALIPAVKDIEAFAQAGADYIRLWPRWLADGDEPVKRVHATGRRLHLNGETGGTAETLKLLAYRPDSLSSDHPRRQRATLRRIATASLPEKLTELVEFPSDARIERPETAVGDRSFLNRDYVMQDVPAELEGLPRIAFDGGTGSRITFRFRQPAVVFAAFDFNATGAWSFPNRRSPKDFGWQPWKTGRYRGTSNGSRAGKVHHANIWFREYQTGQELSGLPNWWVCLGITGVPRAQTIEGFTAGLISDTPAPARFHSHSATAAKPRPLNLPEFTSKESITQWQQGRRQRFVKQMLYPYAGDITVEPGETVAKDGFRQEEFHVNLDGARLFRFFKLTPDDIRRPAPTIVCFMGHGKVQQILEDEASYQHACAAQFSRAGYAVFAMENIGMEPGADTHHDLDRSLRLEGHGWYSLLFAHQRILLDRVFTDPTVDGKRVGVTGVSTGGLLALSAAVMEPRIAAASVQGIFGSMRVSFIRDRHSHCGCGAIPGLLPEFDLPALALLVAPRPLHISNGEKDGFHPGEAARCLKLIEPIYVRAGGDKPGFSVPPGGHAFAFDPAAKFFRLHLQ